MVEKKNFYGNFKCAGPSEPVHVPGGPHGEERAPLLQAPLRERGGAHAHRVHPHRRPRLPEVRPCF